MEDYQIVELYWARSEAAINESHTKYGRMLFGISFSLLSSREDSEECLNDTYLEAWGKMPSDRPTFLGAYLSKIIRYLSISRFRSSHREKRGGMGQITEELKDCIPDSYDVSEELENRLLRDTLNKFILSLDEEKRFVFVRRYFYSDSIEDISHRTGMSIAKIKTMLHRTRRELKTLLEKEELFL
jgi:RNA polymerase sigma-70 factor (ECF subfamily)